MLAHFRATLDYGGRRLCLEHVLGFAPPPFERTGFVAQEKRHEAFEIVRIRPGSAAARADLRAGDEFVAVDGRPPSDMRPRERFHRVRRPAGTPLVLRVAPDGEPRELAVELADERF